MKPLLIASLFAAAPVAAQDNPATFGLPAGCTAFVTVQHASCTVDHHFTCDADPAGHQRRVSLDERGMTYMGTIDRETQWLNSYHALSPHFENLAADPADPASLSELIANGIDTYDFQTTSPEIGVSRYVGADTLTGRSVVIDDIVLDETEYQITAYAADGSEKWSSKGHEFISRNWRMFLSGVRTITTLTDTFETDDTPVEFIFPGEPGFLSANPKHGCGVVMSSLSME